MGPCCALCFRTLERASQWTTCKGPVLSALVQLDAPPYAHIILTYLQHMETVKGHEDALLCAYCTSFMKERVRPSPSPLVVAAAAAAVVVADVPVDTGRNAGSPKPKRAKKRGRKQKKAEEEEVIEGICDDGEQNEHDDSSEDADEDDDDMVERGRKRRVRAGGVAAAPDLASHAGDEEGDNDTAAWRIVDETDEDDEEEGPAEAGYDDGGADFFAPSSSAQPTALAFPDALHSQIRKGRKHGMQLTVEHVLSGGTLPAPSRPHFLRCLAILAQPHHPFLQAHYGNLRDRIAVFQRCEQTRRDNIRRRALNRRRRRALAALGPLWQQEERRRSGAAESPPALHREEAEEKARMKKEEVTSSASPHFFSVLHWLFDGRPRVFCDATLARNMRRWMSELRAHTPAAATAAATATADETMRERRRGRHREAVDEISDVMDGCQAWSMPPACRFCCAYEQMSHGDHAAAARLRCLRTDVHSADVTSYSGVLAFGRTGVPQAIEKALTQAENDIGTRVDLAPGLMLFCIRCHRVAAVSYEYDAALRTRLGLPVTESPDAYYAHVIVCSREKRSSIAMARKKKSEDV